VPPGRGGHGLDHLSIVQAIQVSFDEHRGDLERLDIDVAVGYRKSNTSPILELFLSRLDELVGPDQSAICAITKPRRSPFCEPAQKTPAQKTP
jgi:hypothetical protein